MKDELMLMGFISLTITILQDPVSRFCVPSSAYNKWTPCNVSKRPRSDGTLAPGAEPALEQHRRKLLASAESSTNSCQAGYEPFITPNTIHQLHIFIVVLALVHVLYSCLTIVLALTKVYRWRKWEDEAHCAATEASWPDLVRNITYNRQSTFVRYHTSKPWSRSRLVVWVVCFFQQFYIPRADYLALRLSFITTHNLKDMYDFHGYMVRTMEDEFETIVGISSWLWGFVVILWVLNVDGAQLYFWTSLIPIVVVFIIGTKLQHVIATLALENSGIPGPLAAVLLKPRDQLFWFNRPKLLLNIIHLVLFETAFEFATFIWHVWQFGFNTCLLENNKLYVWGRIVIGLCILFFTCFSTLPLYALVTQMGSSYKKAVLTKNVERVLRQWHKDAKQRVKANATSASFASDPSAPSSSSLILHFKSKISRCAPSEFSRRFSSRAVDVRMEEGDLDRTNAPPSPTTAESIWGRPLRSIHSIERAAPISNAIRPQHAAATTSTTSATSATTTPNPAKPELPFLTPHPYFHSGAGFQRQRSTPSFEIHHV